MRESLTNQSGEEVAHEAAERLFQRYEDVFGDDLAAYRGHVHRVIALTAQQGDLAEDLANPLGVAAFFHDAGIWFDSTWDYLPSSVARAKEELGDDQGFQADLVSALIDEHHRLTKAHNPHPLVEAFRVADRYDVYFGFAPARGVKRSYFRRLRSTYPNVGFRRVLARAFWSGLKENPRRPLPMLKR